MIHQTVSLGKYSKLFSVTLIELTRAGLSTLSVYLFYRKVQNNFCESKDHEALGTGTLYYLGQDREPSLHPPFHLTMPLSGKGGIMTIKVARRTRDDPADLIPVWWIGNESYLSEMRVQEMACAHHLVHVNQRSDLNDNSNQLKIERKTNMLITWWSGQSQ